MRKQRKGLPESEYSAEENVARFADRTWIRKRWRKRRGEPVASCVQCGAHLNRKDTYYVRPAYTDGESWLCSACYDRMTQAADETIDHRYGRRRHDE